MLVQREERGLAMMGFTNAAAFESGLLDDAVDPIRAR